MEPEVLLRMPAPIVSVSASLWACVAAGPPAPSDVEGATGEDYFAMTFTPEQGLGPLFNGASCLSCHSDPTPGGMAPEDGLEEVLRIGFLDQSFDDLDGRGGPVARAHSVSELGAHCDLRPGVPANANVVSVRNSPPLYGLGAIDALDDADILRAGVDNQGFPNLAKGPDGTERVARFGWKADSADLERFVAEAFRNELGLTNPMFPEDLIPQGTEHLDSCDGHLGQVEASAETIRLVTDYLAGLPAPEPLADLDRLPGSTVFAEIGCASCHVPVLGQDDTAIALYSDLLLHDLGPSLDDGFVQGQAEGPHWRTTPLWGLRFRQRLLHDGRADNLDDAITAHGGEAAPSVTAFLELDESERAALLDFLNHL